MLQAKKPQPDTESSINRVKLPPESGIRTLSGIKDLLAQAESNRGAQIELAWTADKPDHIFVLDVQWDPNLDDPFWSLYEDNAGDSQKVWGQPFAPSNIELLYDVLVMSCGAVKHSNKLSDILKSQPPSTKEDWSKPIHGQSSLPPNNSQPGSDNQAKAKSTVAGQPGAAAQTKSGSESNKQNLNPDSAPPPGYAFSTYPPPGGAAVAGANVPSTAYTLPPSMPSVAFPLPYPPTNMLPGQAFVLGTPMVAPPGWPYGSSPGTNSSNPGSLSPASGNSYNPPNNQTPGDRLSTLPVDANLFNKNSEISLANLLREAELITEPALAAALKIQDLVQEGSLSVDQAIEILKRHHDKGQAIEDYIDSSMPSSAKENPLKPTPANKAKTTTREMAAAFDLLETAGLLSKEDIVTAKNVSHKHGGNLVSILQAAQKLDAKTFAASITCVELQNEGMMKTEQCVIVLNYCSRSRVGFDEAIDELNWQNPRHAKKK